MSRRTVGDPRQLAPWALELERKRRAQARRDSIARWAGRILEALGIVFLAWMALVLALGR
jgi:hypothetical protein